MYESYKSYKISYKKKYSGKVSYKVVESCWEHVAVALKFSPFRFRLAFNHYRKTLSNQHSIRGTRMYRVHRRSNDRPRRSPRQFDFEISTENNVRFRSNQAFSNTILFIGKGTAPISEITKTVAVACSICCSDATENRRQKDTICTEYSKPRKISSFRVAFVVTAKRVSYATNWTTNVLDFSTRRSLVARSASCFIRISFSKENVGTDARENPVKNIILPHYSCQNELYSL